MDSCDPVEVEGLLTKQKGGFLYRERNESPSGKGGEGDTKPQFGARSIVPEIIRLFAEALPTWICVPLPFLQIDKELEEQHTHTQHTHTKEYEDRATVNGCCR